MDDPRCTRREQSRQRILLQGDPPTPANSPTGCRFRTRCWRKAELEAQGADTTPCVVEMEPPLEATAVGHPAACHFAAVRDVV
ncbi:MAG: hypothetical protein Q8K58_06995 [Acidimicrobiales bacterium]|nr:hypothetical protein [Acidimicrobiales bacterium]